MENDYLVGYNKQYFIRDLTDFSFEDKHIYLLESEGIDNFQDCPNWK